MGPVAASGALGAPGGADAARRAAAQILAERRFQAGPIPRPLHGFLHAVGTLLAPIGRDLSSAFDSVASVLPGGQATLWIALAVAVLAAAMAATALTTRRSLREAAGEPGAGPGARRAGVQDLERAALEAERAGRLREAVRLRFQAGLVRLAERDLIQSAASTPNAQLRRALHSERFDALAGRFDEIVYGGDEARAEDVEAARRDWPLVLEGDR